MGQPVHRTKQRFALPGLALNVPLLARRTPDEVARVLGRPEASSESRHSRHQTLNYQNGDVLVVFTDGKAEWIKVNRAKGLMFSKDALTSLGLPRKRPTSIGEDAMSWNNIHGVREVTLRSNGAGGVSSVVICVETKKNRPSKKRSWLALIRLNPAFGQ